MTKRRNRRQRKKLHLGEFQQLGFEVTARLASSLTEEDSDKLLDAFIEECVEPLGLSFGGGMNDSLDGYVMPMVKGRSASEDEREKVGSWLSARNEFLAVDVGRLTDAWRA